MDKLEILLDMTEHPDRYTEKQMQELLADENMRKHYQMMVWLRESQDPSRPPLEGEEKTSPSMGRTGKAPFLTDGRGRGLYRKIAAAFAGAILMVGLLYAAVRPFWGSIMEVEDTTSVKDEAPSLTGGPGEGLLQEEPVLFQDVPLDSILAVVAQHYGKVVQFRSDELRDMRLIMTWQPTDSLASLIGRLNLFEGLHLTLQQDTLVVESNGTEGE
jgi:hypothetical protein